MRYLVEFKGRPVGAIGRMRHIEAITKTDPRIDPDGARLELYDRWEHISLFAFVREVHPIVVIDDERYGIRQVFPDVVDATERLRDCGPEFANVRLTQCGQDVKNERGEIVGHIQEGVIWK